jgi:hypothetical protein
VNDQLVNRKLLDPSELGGIVADNAGKPGTEAWVTAAGLEGAILMGYTSPNGYARMPEPFRGRRLTYYDVDVAANGGLTYGMDPDGWVGFDTGHGWDEWLDPDVPESEYKRTLRLHGLGKPLPLTGDENFWTLEKLREAVEQLAVELVQWCSAHRDFDGRESMTEQHERLRREMRRFHELARPDLPYDHARTGEAIRRIYTPTVAEVLVDHKAGLFTDREYEWKLEDARRREKEEG